MANVVNISTSELSPSTDKCDQTDIVNVLNSTSSLITKKLDQDDMCTLFKNYPIIINIIIFV